jgi:hypothetical protein
MKKRKEKPAFEYMSSARDWGTLKAQFDEAVEDSLPA